MGLLINIESIDGAGKTTQAPLVKKLLLEAELSVAFFSFPDTPTRCADESHEAHFATGALIERYLNQPGVNGEKINLIDRNDSFFRREWIGHDEEEREESFNLQRLPQDIREKMVAVIQEKLAQMLFSINRRERASALQAALESHDVVIVGRYLSAWTYGVDGGVSRLQLAELEGELPQPDITFLLDIDPAVARSRRSEESRDRYEIDFEKQSRIRGLYSEMVREDAREAESEGHPVRFIRLDATLAPEEVSALIAADVIERLRRA